MNTTGILLGTFVLFATGLGFVWVIKLEYYVGAHVARAVATLGVVVTLLSVLVPDLRLSAVMGILGSTIVWGAIELPQQEQRVAKGMFPANPHKQAKESAKPPGLAENEGSEL
jgi:hypothetical protein